MDSLEHLGATLERRRAFTGVWIETAIISNKEPLWISTY